MNLLILRRLPAVFQPRPLLMIGLSLLLIGLPLSLFLTSLSQFFLAGSFFLEGDWKEKFRRFFRNPIAMSLAGLWLFHVVGLLWSHDLVQGWRDVRIKLPLLVLPVIMAGSGPLEKPSFRFLLKLFIAAVTVASLIHAVILWGWTSHPVQDVRDIFIFNISHIRFSLFTVLAISSAVMLARKDEIKEVMVTALLVLWLTAFLWMAALATGLLILLALSLTGLGYWSIQRWKKSWQRIVLLSTVTLLIIGSWQKFSSRQPDISSKTYADPEKVYSPSGTYYLNEPDRTEEENGYRVWCYISDPELRAAWNTRSTTPFDSLDGRGQPLRTTLIRFLSSKGLKKDSVGMTQLSDEEITAITRGLANVLYLDLSPIELRLQETFWEWSAYRSRGDVNGHSLAQRLEYWGNAAWVIRHHPWLGVGTGDLPDQLLNAYEVRQSPLTDKYRLRCHNQYLAVGVALGVIGLSYFIVVLLLPFFSTVKTDVLFWGFWLIVVLSMFTEDTLETQPGATFFALFMALFLCSRNVSSAPEIDSKKS